ncbi:fatty-acyl-CoA synthase [Amycolatopsis xylanica]|uniref:Fatty-acyl-CoA synthase n=1 Tax=Amycolatopsis xylanica TaxID=589385 RepID=A0A1H3P9R0_9PSEU|nr:AMP-binding protein [Amycolatopsis xylanica]SDY97894.1 fatty-acyl-CoA synthase [Amycolatopsis xylanica]
MFDHTIGSLVERCALAYGPEIAVVHGEKRITYRELISRIRRAGRALRGLGLEKGDRVAILMADRPELLDVYYGALWAGLVVVPLNTRLRVADHQHIVCDSGASVLVHDAPHAERVARIRGTSGVDAVVCADPGAVLPGGHALDRLMADQSDGPGAPEVGQDDLYGIYYTLGTTGQPKGVVHSHRTVIAVLFSEMVELGLGARDRFAHVAPLTHAGGGFVLPVWLRGGTNVIVGGFDADALVEVIARERVTATLVAPDRLYRLVDRMSRARAETATLSTVIYGGAPVDRRRLLHAIETCGPIFTQLYGQTEAPNQLTVLTKRDHAVAVASGDHLPLSSCGRPVAITNLRIVDGERREVPAGREGEIEARGPHVMLRYWNRRAETERALRGGRLLTGDRAVTDDRGFVYISRREREVIVANGATVPAREIESILTAHHGVREACVVGIPGREMGDALKAVVVPDPGAAVSEEDLVRWVAERVGGVFVLVEFATALPHTSLGMYDKAAVRSGVWGRRPRQAC